MLTSRNAEHLPFRALEDGPQNLTYRRHEEIEEQANKVMLATGGQLPEIQTSLSPESMVNDIAEMNDSLRAQLATAQAAVEDVKAQYDMAMAEVHELARALKARSDERDAANKRADAAELEARGLERFAGHETTDADRLAAKCDKLAAELAAVRKILEEGIDREKDPTTPVHMLATVAINGIYWRNQELTASRTAHEETRRAWVKLSEGHERLLELLVKWETEAVKADADGDADCGTGSDVPYNTANLSRKHINEVCAAIAESRAIDATQAGARMEGRIARINYAESLGYVRCEPYISIGSDESRWAYNGGYYSFDQLPAPLPLPASSELAELREDKADADYLEQHAARKAQS